MIDVFDSPDVTSTRTSDTTVYTRCSRERILWHEDVSCQTVTPSNVGQNEKKPGSATDLAVTVKRKSHDIQVSRGSLCCSASTYVEDKWGRVGAPCVDPLGVSSLSLCKPFSVTFLNVSPPQNVPNSSVTSSEACQSIHWVLLLSSFL